MSVKASSIQQQRQSYLFLTCDHRRAADTLCLWKTDVGDVEAFPSASYVLSVDIIP